MRNNSAADYNFNPFIILIDSSQNNEARARRVTRTNLIILLIYRHQDETIILPGYQTSDSASTSKFLPVAFVCLSCGVSVTLEWLSKFKFCHSIVRSFGWKNNCWRTWDGVVYMRMVMATWYHRLRWCRWGMWQTDWCRSRYCQVGGDQWSMRYSGANINNDPVSLWQHNTSHTCHSDTSQYVILIHPSSC